MLPRSPKKMTKMISVVKKASVPSQLRHLLNLRRIGQATLEELEEVNIGSDVELRPTFINENCPQKKRK